MVTTPRRADLAISYLDVLDAHHRLVGVANDTPVLGSRSLDTLTGRQVFLKCESFQRTGSFKFRGAYNAISRLTADQRASGVITASSGNHAQGVALAARLLEIPATILMPCDVPAVKLAATRGYGAEVIFFDRSAVDPDDHAREMAQARGMTFIPAYDHPHIMAGQGTAALELLRGHPDLDALVMPVGGGSMISGSSVFAKHLNPDIAVFGVETEGADDTRQSLRLGHRVRIDPPTTIADGIRLRTPGELTFPVVQRFVEDILLVSDDDVRDAMNYVLTRMKLVIEPSGAVPIAALMRGLIPPRYRKVGVIVTGGNMDIEQLAGLADGQETNPEATKETA
jgi:threonine dehydratase